MNISINKRAIRRRSNRTRLIVLIVGLLFLLSPAFCPAADGVDAARKITPTAPESVAAPGGWSIPSPEMGTKTDAYYEVKGKIDTTFSWKSKPFAIQPGGLYRYAMNACWFGGANGCFPAGITSVSNDYSPADTEKPETRSTQIIRVPDNMSETSLRAGQWETSRTLRFTEPTLTPVAPIYQGIRSAKETGPDDARTSNKYAGDFLPLAYGEKIDGTNYRFAALQNRDSGNFDRPLLSSNASFNSTRWTMGNDSFVVYKIALQPFRVGEDAADQPAALRFLSGTFTVNVPYFIGGRCVAEVSTDGENWTPLGSLEKAGNIAGSPEQFFAGTPEAVWIRIRGEKCGDSNAGFQIYGVRFEGQVNSGDYTGAGRTVFADVADPESPPTWFSAKPLFLVDDVLYYLVENKGDQPLEWNPEKRMTDRADGRTLSFSYDKWSAKIFWNSSPIPPKGAALVAEEYFAASEKRPIELSCDFDRTYTFPRKIEPYFIQNYSREIASLNGASDGVSLSWCEPERKVPRNPRYIELLPAEPLKIEAPRNDVEAFQILVRPNRKLTGLTASATDLTGPDGALIPASEIKLCYGYYHHVEIPTDQTCSPGWYADALVPIEKGSDGLGAPLTVDAGKNQPLFAIVSIPEDARPGVYHGTLTVADAAKTLDARIPFELEVWPFAQPKKNRFETAYGFSLGSAVQYHNCKTEEEKRAVWEMYLKCCSEHRISLYDSVPMDSYQIEWDKENLRCKLNFDRFDAEMTRVTEKYNVTTYRLPVYGLGGGTFHSRHPGTIAGFTEEAPEYQKMMADYLGQLEKHLQEKGWLESSYCYWFDEPDPKDYEFVAGGFGKLKKYAPGIGRMLTEEPGEKLCAALDAAEGNVNIWCPISNAYNPEEAKKRMANGERFWWYVCCGPKAPYCTEFTDHPGHELRLWHWQAFERKIVGSLIWITNYWTSSAAFPDSAQNPYLDPMCYVSDYDIPAGTKQYWGNGDGRFMYPPLSAAEPGRNGGKAILEEPVSSIRWESLREGIEDYEMLLTLSEKYEEKKASLSDAEKARIDALFDFSPISESMTKFTDDPGVIRARRHAVAEAIIRLQQLQ